MKPANNSGPTDRVLDDGLEVEAVAQRLGITEDAVRRICRDHEQEIICAMRESAGDLIFALAHHEGLVTLGDPEIPEAVREAVSKHLTRDEMTSLTDAELIEAEASFVLSLVHPTKEPVS